MKGDNYMTISEFQGEYRFLSNFWYVTQKVTLDGIMEYKDNLWYPTVEHAYQAAKSTEKIDRFVIATRLRKPGEAKDYGKTIQLRADWNDIKLNVMYKLLQQKFNQQPLRSQLIATGDHELIEGNRWGDVYWGIDLRTNKGENNLGKLLMAIRSELQQQYGHSLTVALGNVLTKS